jgi:rod shape-determining protein MreC
LPPKRFIFGKPYGFIFIFLILWWLLPTVFRTFGRISFYEFQAPAWSAFSHISDLQEYWALRVHDKNELIAAGRDLARLNAYYSINRQSDVFERQEMERLEAMLQLPSLPNIHYEVARVVRRDINAWWQQLIIRKGKLHGITKGAAVIFNGGVVGRVSEVRLNTSVVELVTSNHFRMVAHIEEDLRPIIVRGGSNFALNPPMGTVSNIPPDVIIDPEKPQRVVSSRMGGIFPDGLTIGWIDVTQPSTDRLFLEGTLRMDPRLYSVREVAVLIPLNHTETYEDAP